MRKVPLPCLMPRGTTDGPPTAPELAPNLISWGCSGCHPKCAGEGRIPPTCQKMNRSDTKPDFLGVSKIRRMGWNDLARCSISLSMIVCSGVETWQLSSVWCGYSRFRSPALLILVLFSAHTTPSPEFPWLTWVDCEWQAQNEQEQQKAQQAALEAQAQVWHLSESMSSLISKNCKG